MSEFKLYYVPLVVVVIVLIIVSERTKQAHKPAPSSRNAQKDTYLRRYQFGQSPLTEYWIFL